MKRRAACLIGFAFACAMFMAACSFSDNASHCVNDSMCPTGRCYEGFCIPAAETTSSSAQTMSDGGTGSGGKGGAGGKNGQTATGSTDKPSGGTGGKSSVGGTGGTGGISPPPASGDCTKEGEERDCLKDPNTKTLAETCNRGKQTCTDGAWSTCDGQPVPMPETCNGLDDDCNDKVDDLLEVCFPDGQAGCSQGADGSWTCTGTCGTGTRTCENNGECKGATAPAMEVCTAAADVARDEDCDGKTDEEASCGDCRAGATRACYSGRAGSMGNGKCVMGTQTCADGAFGACVGEVTPQAETCANPNADDDCNGTTDDIPTLNNKCQVPNAQGPCGNGTLKCSGSTLACVSSFMATTEVCNGRDDDCDGKVDQTFNLRRDPANCGMCNNRCDTGDACCAGACEDTQTSPTNCGACGTKCTATQKCTAGKCVSTTMPMAGMPAGGSGPIAGGGASGGTGGTGAAGGGGACSPACAAGQTCCNGACVNLMTDKMQCGACGNACAGANAECCGGMCTDLTKDENCGACGKNCGLLHVMNGTETVLCQCAETSGTYDCQGRVLGLGLCLL